jgi:hypothetical protein
MKKYLLQVAGVALCAGALQAGNPDRAGGAGATQLLINPYSRSAGMGGANTASVRGVEALHFNVAGLAYNETTELVFARVNYLQGTNTNINTLSFAQAVGSGGNVIGLTITKWDLGNIPITTVEQPEGSLATYSPQFLNIGLAYAKKFSNSITGGIVIRYVAEGITNLTAQGIACDAGVQYQTALNPKNKIKKEDFRFGISVRNIGPDMIYTGNGLSVKSTVDVASGAQRTTQMGSKLMNLPSLVHIGASYDLRLDKNADNYFHRITPSANFNYNAFFSNIVGVGVEYAFRESFMVRGGYNWMEGNTSSDAYRSQYIGVTGGCTVQVPITKSGTMVGIDYAYAPTRIFNGIHNVGIRLVLGNKKS